MSVQNETNRVQYWGNGSTVIAYPVPFYFFEASDLRVVVTDAAGADAELAEGSDYSVAGAGNENGGSVLTASAVPATSRVTIYREVEAIQTTVYEENGEFPAKTHERALDRQTMLNQQNARAFDRALKVRESDGAKAPLTTVGNSVIGFGGDSQPRTFTPGQLAAWLNLTQNVFGEGTKAWLTEADRATAVPDFLGQVGVQLDNSTIWVANGISAGSWTNVFGADGRISTAMLSTGVLSADSTGRAKMADAFITLAKIGAEIFTADSAGRGKFASGFVDSGLCSSGLWNAIAPAGAVLQTVSAVNTETSSTSSAIPTNTDKPKSDQGTQFVAASITPSSTSNKILATYTGPISGSALMGSVVSLFKLGAGVTSALTSTYQTIYASDWSVPVSISFLHSPSSTSSLTYAVRGGPTGSNTIYINRLYSVSYFGGALTQSLTLQEIKG